MNPGILQIIVANADLKLHLVDESGIIRQESEHMSSENMNNDISYLINEIETL